MSYRIDARCSRTRARLGVLQTAHGEVPTPIFMPVGTQATVKAVSPHELHELDAPIILSNTYHLNVRPGPELIEQFGGLHRFMSWDRAILTDSGGYQVFSLAKLRKVTADGVEFRSHVDGAKMFLGPREAMAIQRRLGSDIAMVFDECPAWPCSYDDAARSLELTLKWAAICREQEPAPGQLRFGIVQGSSYPELRRQSAEALADLKFDGMAVGGLSVGEPEDEMFRILPDLAPHLPPELPHYLMGVGTPPQLIRAIAQGIDMFDCVLPTRVGRNGSIFTRDGMVQAKAARYREDTRPLEEGCGCYACLNFSRGYIRHLLNVKEILGLRLLTLHNLYFYLQLMREVRAHIQADTFAQYHDEFLARYQPPKRDAG